jgi:TolB protein
VTPSPLCAFRLWKANTTATALDAAQSERFVPLVRAVSFGRALVIGLMLFCVACAVHRSMNTSNSLVRPCSISPDGSTLVFNEMAGPYWAPGVAYDIYSSASDGSHLKQLTRAPDVCDCPSFSPDGRSIVYISNMPGGWSHIFVMDRNGRNSRQLTFGDWTDSAPSYSRDGRKIVFARAIDRHTYAFPLKIGEMVILYWDIWEMNADGSSLRRLTFEEYFGVDAPYFSPDGHQVLFGADESTWRGSTFKSWHDLLIFDLPKDGSAANLRPVSLPPGLFRVQQYDGQPSFSADGSTIVFSSLRGSPSNQYEFAYDIWASAVDGTNLRQVTHNHSIDQYPVFSPDGRFIYFCVPSDGLWRVTSNGSKPVKLVP